MRVNPVGRILILISLNLVLFVPAVTAFELMFGDWFAEYLPPISVDFDRKFEFEQQLYEPHGLVSFVRDRYGLRGVRDRLDEIEVVTVGGSTTIQRLITEGKTWQDVIRTLTGIPIANAGVEGLSSSGHVFAVVNWLHRIRNLHPQYYVHYVGVNDAWYADRLRDRREVIRKMIEDEEAAPSLTRILRMRSIVFKSYLRLTAWLKGPPRIFAPGASSETDDRLLKAEVNREEIREYIERVYEPNLNRLIRLHKEKGEKVILVSQPGHPSMIKRVGQDMFVRGDAPGYWAVALLMMNDATESVCRAHPGDCRFVDLARNLEFSSEDFYDLVHTTPAGARRIGVFLADQLAMLFSPPRQREAKN
jgi:hypothetical protein